MSHRATTLAAWATSQWLAPRPAWPLGEPMVEVELVAEYPLAIGRGVMLSDVATLEGALDVLLVADDVDELERRTDTAGLLPVGSRAAWRARLRFACSYTGGEIEQGIAGAIALGSFDDARREPRRGD